MAILGVLKCKLLKCLKMQPLLHKIAILVVIRGPRWSQVEPMLAQVDLLGPPGAFLGPLGVLLERSWGRLGAPWRLLGAS